MSVVVRNHLLLLSFAAVFMLEGVGCHSTPAKSKSQARTENNPAPVQSDPISASETHQSRPTISAAPTSATQPAASISVDRAAAAELAAETSSAETQKQIAQLVQYMTGQFSNAEQARADADFGEFTLKIAPVWVDSAHESSKFKWLYVEQAPASDPDHPYRQRMYRLWSPFQSVIEVDMYSFPNPAFVAGAWQDPAKLDVLKVGDLSINAGCAVYLSKSDDRFIGGTRERECTAERGDGKYATRTADVGADDMATWDRGFDASGRQVWGAIKGPYRFKKLTSNLSQPTPLLNRSESK